MDIISGIISGVSGIVSGFLGWDIQKRAIASTERQNLLGVNDNAYILQYAISKSQAEQETKKINNIAGLILLGVIGLVIIKGLKK